MGKLSDKIKQQVAEMKARHAEHDAEVEAMKRDVARRLAEIDRCYRVLETM